jgi:hypothetical protein
VGKQSCGGGVCLVHAGEALISISAGRCPTLDAALPQGAVPNDVELHGDQLRAMVISGPNMGGKSSYMCQARFTSSVLITCSLFLQALLHGMRWLQGLIYTHICFDAHAFARNVEATGATQWMSFQRDHKIDHCLMLRAGWAAGCHGTSGPVGASRAHEAAPRRCNIHTHGRARQHPAGPFHLPGGAQGRICAARCCNA